MGVMAVCEIHEIILIMVQFLSKFNKIQDHEVDSGETLIQIHLNLNSEGKISLYFIFTEWDVAGKTCVSFSSLQIELQN